MGRMRQLEPLDFPTHMDAATINLQATAGNTFKSGPLNVENYFGFTFVGVRVKGTTTVGAYKLTVNTLKKNRTDKLWGFDMVTGMNPAAASGEDVLIFGAGQPAFLVSTSTGALSADADGFKHAVWMELIIEIVTQADGNATLECHLIMTG